MSNAATRAQVPATERPMPWWRYGMVWLVVGGPATVVVAGIVTAFIAISGADEVLDTSARRPDGSVAAPAGPRADTPAVQARNHAATPAPAGN